MGHGSGILRCRNNSRTQRETAPKGKPLCDMFPNVKVFEAKLWLQRKLNGQQTATNFRSCKTVSESPT